MGRHQIAEKLDKEINKDIKEECQVVYILSRVRKLLEIYEPKNKYLYLKMYCSWSLHNKLDRKNSISALLNSVEKDIDLNSDGHRIARILIKKHGNFFKLHIFKDELFDFLSKLGVSLNNLEKNWKFMMLLLDIIEDCPINFENIKRENKKIKEIKLEKEDKDYKYRFSLFGTKEKPKVKLKLKLK